MLDRCEITLMLTVLALIDSSTTGAEALPRSLLTGQPKALCLYWQLLLQAPASQTLHPLRCPPDAGEKSPPARRHGTKTELAAPLLPAAIHPCIYTSSSSAQV